MKLLFGIGYVGLFLALFLIFMHWPGGSITLLLASCYQFILSFSYLFIQKYLSQSFKYLSLAFFSMYLTNRILIWDFGPFLLGIALAFFVLFLLFLAKEKRTIADKSFYLVCLIAIVNIGISFVPKSTLFYTFNMHPPLDARINEVYYPWMMYSNLLEEEGKLEKALDMNLKAQLIIDNQYIKSQEVYVDVASLKEGERVLIELKIKEQEIREKILLHQKGE